MSLISRRCLRKRNGRDGGGVIAAARWCSYSVLVISLRVTVRLNSGTYLVSVILFLVFLVRLSQANCLVVMGAESDTIPIHRRDVPVSEI